MTWSVWAALALVAGVIGCASIDAPREPSYAEREAAREGPKTSAPPAPEPPWIAQARATAKRHSDEAAEAERQRDADHEASCATDRESRRAHILENRRVDAADAAELERRTRYAQTHCRRVTKPIMENQGYVDEKGYVRVTPVEVSRVEEWSCPKGAPEGIDGNTDIVGPSHGHYDAEEYRQNERCRDVDGFESLRDGGAP